MISFRKIKQRFCNHNEKLIFGIRCNFLVCNKCGKSKAIPFNYYTSGMVSSISDDVMDFLKRMNYKGQY